MKVFISYSRDCEPIAQQLVRDLAALGHLAWFDKDLSGGHVWWEAILEEIRRADLFIAAVSPRALSSVACKREIAYAAALNKRVLPILVSPDVTPNVLSPALSIIQFVDYRDPASRDSALMMARALQSLPALQPPPDPLPTPPDAPISRLTELRQRIERADDLSAGEQSTTLLELTQALRDPDEAAGARTLLELFGTRNDLRVPVAEEIKVRLAENKAAPRVKTVHARPVAFSFDRFMRTRRARTLAGGLGAIGIVSVIAIVYSALTRETPPPQTATTAPIGDVKPPPPVVVEPEKKPEPAPPPPPPEPTAEDRRVAESLYVKAVDANQENRLQEAESYLEDAVARDRKHLKGWRLLCEIRSTLQKGGVEECAAAIALKDDDPRIEYFFFEAARGRQTGEACGAAARAVKMNPRFALGYYARALCHQYTDSGTWEDALRDFRDAYRYDAALWPAHYGAALMLYHLDRYAEADGEATKALQGNPNSPESYDLRGFIRWQMGAKDPAKADFGAAVRLAPGETRFNHTVSNDSINENPIPEPAK